MSTPGWRHTLLAYPELGALFDLIEEDRTLTRAERTGARKVLGRQWTAIGDLIRRRTAQASEATTDAGEALARLEACEEGGRAREALRREALRGVALASATVAQMADLVPREGDVRALPRVAEVAWAHGRNALALAETGRFAEPAGGGGSADVEGWAAERAGEAVQAFADAAVAVGALDPGRIGEVLAALSGRALPAAGGGR